MLDISFNVVNNYIINNILANTNIHIYIFIDLYLWDNIYTIDVDINKPISNFKSKPYILPLPNDFFRIIEGCKKIIALCVCQTYPYILSSQSNEQLE